MKTAIRMTTPLTLFAAMASASMLSANAQDAAAPSKDAATIQLPAIKTTGGVPLMEAISKRKSSRDFAPTPLSLEHLGGILWATAGYNRPEAKMRVAASSRNHQAVEILAVLEAGIYAYDAEKHALNLLAAGDHRKLAGPQPFVATAPLNLVFVGDADKIKIDDLELRMLSFGADAGLMAQNAYLYCASENLGCVVRTYIQHDPLAKLLNLPKNKRVLLGQTIGYPAQ
ncbi:MAG: nitroreductase family protein [Kiritimatiellia bacterium]|jgi:nitroreductase